MMGWGSLVGRALRARRADGSESRPYPCQVGRLWGMATPIRHLDVLLGSPDTYGEDG